MTSRDLTVYSCPNICTVFCSILIFPSWVSHSASRLSLSTSPSCPSGEKEKKNKKKSPVNFIISPAEWMLYFPRVQVCLFFFSFFVECCPIYCSNLSYKPSVHTVLNASRHTLLKSLWGLISLDCLVLGTGQQKNDRLCLSSYFNL